MKPLRLDAVAKHEPKALVAQKELWTNGTHQDRRTDVLRGIRTAHEQVPGPNLVPLVCCRLRYGLVFVRAKDPRRHGTHADQAPLIVSGRRGGPAVGPSRFDGLNQVAKWHQLGA